MAPLALPHCLGLPFWHHPLLALSVRVTSVKSAKSLGVSELHRTDKKTINKSLVQATPAAQKQTKTATNGLKYTQCVVPSKVNIYRVIF